MKSQDMNCLKISDILSWIPNNMNNDYFLLKISFPVGLLSEDNDTLEYSHVIEHLLDMYTSSKYPSSADNKGFFISSGIHHNASTYMESTAFTFHGSSNFFDEMIDIVFNAFHDLSLNMKDMNAEKNACVQELVEYQTEEYRNRLMCSKLMYGDHRENIPIDELIVSVQNATLQKLTRFFFENYFIRESCISIYSKFDLTKSLTQHLHKANTENTKEHFHWVYPPRCLISNHIFISNGEQILDTNPMQRYELFYKKTLQGAYALPECEAVRTSLEYIQSFLRVYLLLALRYKTNMVYYIDVNLDCYKMPSHCNKMHFEMTIVTTTGSHKQALEIAQIIDEFLGKSMATPVIDQVILAIMDDIRDQNLSHALFKSTTQSLVTRVTALANKNIERKQDGYFKTGFSEQDIENTSLACDLTSIHPIIRNLVLSPSYKIIFGYQ
mgnify:CR=1 FL=1|tara:strand:+ start:2173 stop:3492 length:1320 start_codon:yes stop_codon:yes gene_type:complete